MDDSEEKSLLSQTERERGKSMETIRAKMLTHLETGLKNMRHK